MQVIVIENITWVTIKFDSMSYAFTRLSEVYPNGHPDAPELAEWITCEAYYTMPLEWHIYNDSISGHDPNVSEEEIKRLAAEAILAVDFDNIRYAAETEAWRKIHPSLKLAGNS